jgi:hypothetical protein
MLTDDDVIMAARSQMDKAVNDLEVPDLLAQTRRRYRSRNRSLIAGSLLGFTAIATAVVLSISSLSPRQKIVFPSVMHTPTQPGQVVLAGFAFEVPAPYTVVSTTRTAATATSGTGTIHYEVLMPPPAPPAGAQRVSIGQSNNYWYLQTPPSKTLYVYAVGVEKLSATARPKLVHEAVSITVTNMTRQELFSLLKTGFSSEVNVPSR